MFENKLGITSMVELIKAEEEISKKKALELFDNGSFDRLDAGSVSSLKFIHKALFGDIYDFAGELRTANISTDGFRFTSVIYLEEALQNIDKMPQTTFDEIIEKYVEINIAHPFRESNGRVARIWLDCVLKKEIGMVVYWCQVDKEDYLIAMKCSPVKDAKSSKLLKML